MRYALNESDVRTLREMVAAWQRGEFRQMRAKTRQRPTALPSRLLIPCRLWQDGGTSDGDGTTQCNRTYTAKEITATAADDDTALTYGTAMTPSKLRPATGQLLVPPTTGDGVIGLGYWDADGDFVLWEANERPVTAIKEVTLTVTEAGAAPTNQITGTLAQDGANKGELALVGDDYGAGAGDQIIGVEDQGGGIVEIHHWDANAYAPAITSYDLTGGGQYLHCDRAGHVLRQDNTP